jgi:endo-1,4-beta-xylanase
MPNPFADFLHARRQIVPIGRRGILAGATATAVGWALGALEAAPAGDGLKARAARRGISYGCMVCRPWLQETDFSSAVVRESAIIVPGNEMKWGATQPRRGPANYSAADDIARFAANHTLALRGHTAVWHKNLPKWAAEALRLPSGRDVLLQRVRDIVGHFRGRVAEWDVVNEAIEPKHGLEGGLRHSPLYTAAGKGFIADCFHAAHEADPRALLVYNEYDLFYDTPAEELRRSATLRLMSELKRANVPVHGLGLQCHLKVGNRFNEKLFRSFLKDAAALGLRITITELDIDDERLPADAANRDHRVADHARHFLDVALDEPAIKSVLSWGLSDRYTWLNTERPRADGGKKRPLPLDELMARKPLWHALATSFDSAPKRV